MNHQLKEWAERPRVLALLTVLFFPLGLFLVWRSSVLSLKAKQLWTAGVVAVVIIAAMNKKNNESPTNVGEAAVASSDSSTAEDEAGAASSDSSAAKDYTHSREEMEELFKTLVYKIRKGMQRTAVVGLLGEPDVIQKNDLGEFNPDKNGQVLEILTWGTKDDANSFIMLSFVNGMLNGGGSTGYDIETGFKQK